LESLFFKPEAEVSRLLDATIFFAEFTERASVFFWRIDTEDAEEDDDEEEEGEDILGLHIVVPGDGDPDIDLKAK